VTDRVGVPQLGEQSKGYNFFPVPCSNCIRRQRAESCRAIGHSEDQIRSVQGQTRETLHSNADVETETSRAVPRDNRTSASAPSIEQAQPQNVRRKNPVEPPTGQGRVSSGLLAAASHRMVPLPQDLLSTAALQNNVLPEHMTELNPADEHVQDGSHGTLLLSKEGRARYLGPTAGSEWLKDVSPTCMCAQYLC